MNTRNTSIRRRPAHWYAINITARRDQTTAHYIEAFQRLCREDPMIDLPRGKSSSLKAMEFASELTLGYPSWIKISLLSYTIIEEGAFYNRRIQENVSMDWNSDIVANKQEANLIFIPSVHILILKCNSGISLKSVVKYFTQALNNIECDGFNVDVVIARDFLNRILQAHAVIRLHANISYSNPGHTRGFQAVFDEKMRELEAERIDITATGTTEHPLNNANDGLLSTLVNISERNGHIKATIQPTRGARLEKIDSDSHPRKLVLPPFIEDIVQSIRNLFQE